MLKKTNYNNINTLSAEDVKLLLSNICSDRFHNYFKLAISNTQKAKDFLMTENKHFFDLVACPKDEIIVEKGKMKTLLQNNQEYTYAFVPLGFILEGEIIVHKGGKATKKLSEGDFIGLFETADWLLTSQKREIGDWTLTAATDSKILFFPAAVLSGESDHAQNFRDYLIQIARNDIVPQPITTLPLLDWTASHTTKSRLQDYAIVAHTHLLPNTFPYFRHLSYLVDFGKIYILEKPYSTVPKTSNDLIKAGAELLKVETEASLPYEYSIKKSVELLWAKVIEDQKRGKFNKILVIDDGGELWHSVPWEDLKGVLVAGVEQTQRGITRVINSSHHIPPIINVASSGAKKIVESIFIGQSIVDKFIDSGLLAADKKIGIIGIGAIGTAIANYLQKNNQKSYFYDPIDLQNISTDSLPCPSMDSLLNTCDIIIGTSGLDALKGIAFDRVSGHKILASASSADVEFASLLKLAEPANNSFETRHVVVHDNLTIDILNGGFPLNFDRQNNATKDEDIVLTWCLMYVGAMQAVKLIEDRKQEGKIYALDRVSQRQILNRWIDDKKAAGAVPPVDKNDVEKIVSYTTKENDPEMPTVWQE